MEKKEIEILKKNAYEILKQMKKSADEGDLKKYILLKKDFSKLMRITFGERFIEDKIHFVWDATRNQIDHIFSYKNAYDAKKISDDKFNDLKISSLKKFSKLMEELKKEL